MKQLPDDIVSGLLRYLPLLMENLDPQKMRTDVRLMNAVRMTRHRILPRIRKTTTKN